MTTNPLRIVQVSAARFGVEQHVTVAETTGRLWWKQTVTRQQWQPWGSVYNPKKVLFSNRFGTIYGDMVRRYFDSIEAAEAYIQESRVPYPLVVKDPA